MSLRNHIAFKFIAVLLCAVFLCGAVISGLGIAVLVSNDLYNTHPSTLLAERQENNTYSLAFDLAQRYALMELGGCPEEVVEDYYGYYVLHPETYLYNHDYSGEWYYTIQDEKQATVEAEGTRAQGLKPFIYTLSVPYYHVLDQYVEYQVSQYEENANTTPTFGGYDTEVPVDEGMAVTEPVVVETAPGNDFWTQYEGNPQLSVYDYEEDAWVYYTAEKLESPELTVTLYLDENAFIPSFWELFELFWSYRYDVIWVAGLCLLLFAVCAVYLCCAAGHKPGTEEIKATGFNNIPLDLYAAAVLGAISLMAVLAQESAHLFDNHQIGFLAFLAAELFAGCLLAVGFCFACAAQFKMGASYWLLHTVFGLCCVYGIKALVWCWHQFLRFCGWLDKWLPGLISKVFSTLWRWTKTVCVTLWKWLLFLCKKFAVLLEKGCDLLGKGFRWIGHYINRVYSLLPLTWQWLLVGFGMMVLMYLAFASYSGGWMLVGIGLTFAIILYGANCFGILMESTKRMSKGDLYTKISDQFLTGAFKDFAGDLNVLADVVDEAAQKQMKSERMKAELVTNVSHDIKTPLTSIINYVDLLQKATTEEEKQEYLEVLERQSLRLKKLIEDLMEMSKANTGNIAVDIRCVEATETINQALGEFADKLAAAQLTPIFKAPAEPVYMKADGRLAWRVLSNLLSNAVKYALPGTRLYIDLVTLEGKVLISLKNISKEELNVSSEELMERFVRGDASRNTEGSGLGLNIAKSLMELQNGQLQLLVDGDLFKATMIFPQVEK